MKECNKSKNCPYGCWLHENTCALSTSECPKEIEDYECYELEMEKEKSNYNK